MPHAHCYRPTALPREQKICLLKAKHGLYSLCQGLPLLLGTLCTPLVTTFSAVNPGKRIFPLVQVGVKRLP